MQGAGYRFINIDDGYFSRRDAAGKLVADARKFPSGMQSLVEYILGKGLKAGIYTDAGANTCGSICDKDPNDIGVLSKKNKLRDFWLHQELGPLGSIRTFTLSKHGVVVLNAY